MPQDVMGHIAIKLNRTDLQNPDADLRYRIADLAAKLTNGRVTDDGYDYANDDVMTVFLRCNSPAVDVADVIKLLEQNKVCDNDILDAAIIGISDGATTFRIVHPSNRDGTFIVDDW